MNQVHDGETPSLGSAGQPVRVDEIVYSLW